VLHIIHGNAAGPTPWTATWLWIGAGFQIVGFLAVVAIASRMRKEDQSHVVPAIFVNLIAACAYFAMATGQLDIRVGHDHVMELPRYLDWLITTPLLVTSLSLVALPSIRHLARSRERSALVGGLIGAQALLILTGIFATLQTTSSVKWSWYGISCAFQLVVWWLQWGPIRRSSAAHGGAQHRLYTRLLAYLTTLWLAYPVVWALGSTGADIWGRTPDDAIYMGLDTLAKTVFNVILLTGILRLSRTVATVQGHDTVDIVGGVEPDDAALDEQARSGPVHLEPAVSGGVLLEVGNGNGHRH
jgi:bacteriorhodopsin